VRLHLTFAKLTYGGAQNPMLFRKFEIHGVATV